MGMFDSPRERAAPGLYGQQLQGYDDLMKQAGGMSSSYGGINSIYDIMNKFGLKKRTPADVSSSFNPARGNLATRQAMANRSAAARISGSNATPGMTFGDITSSFAPAWGDLESTSATKGLDVARSDEQNIASMLDEILNSKDQFAMNKTGMQTKILGQKGNAVGNYVNSLSGASTFDDIMSMLGTGSKFIKPL